jgi:hypothetical protein
MTGTTLRSLEYVPTILLRDLGRQFVQKTPDLATLRTLYRRSQTLYEHPRWAIEFLGLRKFDESVDRRLSAYIGERTQATLSRMRLEQMAREWLYRTYVEIPGNRVTADLVRAVVHVVLLHDHETLRQHRSDSSVKGCLAALLQHRAGHAMTHLEPDLLSYKLSGRTQARNRIDRLPQCWSENRRRILPKTRSASPSPCCSSWSRWSSTVRRLLGTAADDLPTCPLASFEQQLAP